MVKKLRKKFIALSMISLFCLLTLVVSGMNILNYFSIVNRADEILSVISINEGQFPDFKKEPKPGMDKPKRMTGETPYESRFFSIVLNTKGDTVSVNTSRIAAIDREEAIDYAKQAIAQKNVSGFIRNYRYIISPQYDDFRVTFLDCSRDLESFRFFLIASISMALAGYALVFFIVILLSKRIIKPVSESYEKQKQFITDAGHEIKTPLTIINANLDLLECDYGENESIDDIKFQTKRLTELTNRLVYLTKMEESENCLNKIDFPISDVISETAQAFVPLAKIGNKEIKCDVQPMLSMNGDEESIRELITILVDNAVKYSPNGEEIKVEAKKQGKQIKISVENGTENIMNPDETERLFDRFYRTDKSRNSETGGYGIGLSIAYAIVESHGGKIIAEADGDKTFRINVRLPL